MLRVTLTALILALALPAGASAQYANTAPLQFPGCFGVLCPPPPVRAEPPGHVYPSRVGVSGAGAYVTGIAVTLSNISHENEQNLDVLLVGPNGEKTLVKRGSWVRIPPSASF